MAIADLWVHECYSLQHSLQLRLPLLCFYSRRGICTRQVHFYLLLDYGVEAFVAGGVWAEFLSQLNSLFLQQDILDILVHVFRLVFFLKAFAVHFDKGYFVLIELIEGPFKPLQPNGEHFTLLEVEAEVQTREVPEVVDASFRLQLPIQPSIDKSERQHALKVSHIRH